MQEEIRKYMAESLEMDDVEIQDELLMSFKETLEEGMQKLKAALDAGETMEAAGVAHSIKGAAANIGAKPIFEVAKDCELTLKGGALEEGRGIFPKLDVLVNQLCNELA